jgi:CheY-like chemotaxis protein
MNPKQWRVLFLDDSSAALSAVERALSNGECQVRTATTLGEAIPWVSASDVIVVDFHMPGINGAEAVKRLRSHVSPQLAPVFYLYTTDTEVASAFRRHGFDGAFTDKGNTQTLVTQLASALRLLTMRRYMGGLREA